MDHAPSADATATTSSTVPVPVDVSTLERTAFAALMMQTAPGATTPRLTLMSARELMIARDIFAHAFMTGYDWPKPARQAADVERLRVIRGMLVDIAATGTYDARLQRVDAVMAAIKELLQS